MTTKAEKRFIPNEWKPAHIRTLVSLYNSEDENSIKEIAYRLNKKFKDVTRNTQSVSQRLVAIRNEDKKALRKRDKGAGYTSDAAVKAMAKLDEAALKRARERKAERAAAKATPRRSSKDRKGERQNGKLVGDPMLNGSGERVLECDLGERGKVRVEISGPLLLNEQFVNNLSAAVGSALTI